MAKNTRLSAAKNAKNDEFYTQLTDIEKELRHYRIYFKDKTVLCNCDDPFESNFFKYFVLNFNRLGLKKLIATCYATSPIMGKQLQYIINKDGQMSFNFGDDSIEDDKKHPYKAVVTQVYDKTGDGGVDMIDVAELFVSGENSLTELIGDGDFRSEECLALLDEADIVVTNPPFSLFREYIAVLVKHKKRFIVLGHLNALKYKEIFGLLARNELWAGYGFNLSMVYRTPYPNKLESNRKFVISHGYDPDDGYLKVPAITWYTNLDIKKRHENLILVKRYVPEMYPEYINFDAIDVSCVSDIPCDYSGKMGVPITIMETFNPDQFELIGTSTGELGRSIGVKPNHRGRTDVAFLDDDGHPKCPFQRFIIRNKHPEQPKGGQQ